MPIFYLHICNDRGFIEDLEGVELRDFEAAHRAAVEGLRDMLAADVRKGVLKMSCSIRIEDQSHKLLSTVPFDQAVRISS
jgi:hypothetical protein